MNSSSPLRKRSHRKSGRRGGSFLPEVSGALPSAPPPGADRELAEAFHELSAAYADLHREQLPRAAMSSKRGSPPPWRAGKAARVAADGERRQVPHPLHGRLANFVVSCL